ncbi:hypothetical protein C6A85_01940, partial [Mycobacterium sp. ITM-2017-0098]
RRPGVSVQRVPHRHRQSLDHGGQGVLPEVPGLEAGRLPVRELQGVRLGLHGRGFGGVGGELAERKHLVS